MPKPFALDPAKPVQSLLDGLGANAYAAAKALDRPTAAVCGYRDSGERVRLDSLLALAAALGAEVEIRVTPPRK